MKLLVFGIIKEIIYTTLLVLFLFTAVFMLFATRRIFDVIDLIFNRNVNLGIIFHIFSLLMPYFISLTLPISLLVAVLVIFGRLVLDQEWLAFQAGGISPWSILIPVLTLGLLVSLLLTYTAEKVVPQCYRNARALIYQAVGNAALSLRENTFNPIGKDVVLYFHKRNETTGELQHLIVLYSEKKKLRRVFLAPRGKILFNSETGIVQLELEQGTFHETVENDPALYYIGSFNKYRQFISLADLLPHDEKAQISSKEMSRPELYSYISQNKQKKVSTAREEFELAQRPAKSFGAFVFVLIGIPLGIFWTKFGRSIGMAIELGLALCIPYFYYALMTFGEDLARGRIISMWLGAWLPNIILGCIGFILLWRSCRQQ